MIPKNCHYPKVYGNKPIESGTLVQCLPLYRHAGDISTLFHGKIQLHSLVKHLKHRNIPPLFAKQIGRVRAHARVGVPT